jgi:polyhydroxybutyrate depolymerase
VEISRFAETVALMKKLLLAIGLLALLGAATSPRVTHHTLDAGGETRTYEVELPANVVAKPALIVMLHGHGGTGAQMRRYKDMGQVTGDAAVIVYPDGVDRGWSDGRTIRNSQDDIGFLRRLIATVHAAYGTDPKRIYVAGMSNGAMMALRVACQMPEVAAVAAVSGGLPVQWKDDCRPAHPVSVLGIDGTADPIVPFDGGGVYNDRNGDVLSAAETVATFARADGCGAGRTLAPTAVASDGTSATFERWSDCAAGTSVELATVHGGGHGWPGGRQYFPKRLVGTVSQAFDANAYIWDFFRTKSL